MAKRPRTSDDYDSPWKDALQAYLPAFMLFFFPDIHADIDWTRGYVSLDKEFQQLLRKAKIGKRLADKLFKVWLKNGEECWLLIHVEIQGGYEKTFPERMFEYHVAIRKMYNHKSVGLAVLCDDNVNWKPTRYEYDQWGCGLTFTYRVAKLLELLPRMAELESSDNPIAAIVCAHLQAMQTRDDPASRKHLKLRLMKGLLQRSWTNDEIRELFRLIDWIMTLPDDLDDAFLAEFLEFETRENMPYVTTFERAGIAKGLRKGRLEGIALALEVKFGAEGRKLLRKARSLELDELRKLARLLKRAETLDEVREYLK
jgi:hypothetical protein